MTPTTERRTVFAIDFGTGTRGSGWVLIDTTATAKDPVGPHNTDVIDCGMNTNEKILEELTHCAECIGDFELALEMIQSFNNKQGSSIHHTLLWIGRAVEVYRSAFDRLPNLVLRSRTKAWVAGAKATDSKVLKGVSNRFEGTSLKGTKANPGPLYGFKKDIWQAMAAAIAFVEGCKTETYLG